MSPDTPVPTMAIRTFDDSSVVDAAEDPGLAEVRV